MTTLTAAGQQPGSHQAAPADLPRTRPQTAAAWLTALRRVTDVLTPLGRTVLFAGIVSWVIGWRLGWQEFMLAAAVCALLLVLGLAFTFGRMTVDVAVTMQPQRVVVGDTASGQMTALNSSVRRLLALRVELVVGQGMARFDIPILPGGQSHDALFSIPTHRRAVIPIGPARTLRGDPLGLLRRALDWPSITLLYVHPLTTPLEGLGAGFLRDLEGRNTNDTSTSDVELHTLRDYVPGDDRRYVHWRTSAKSGKLMVRQFVDTRRSHVAVLQSGDSADYASENEFELGVSMLASIGVRAVRDQQSIALMAARRTIGSATPTSVLDGASAIEMAGRGTGLADSAAQVLRRDPDVTLVLLVTGSLTPLPALREAAARFGPDAKIVILRAEPGATSGVRQIGTTLLVTVGALRDLARIVRAVSQA